MAADRKGYEYDVFFSFKRQELTLDWNRQVYRRIEHWLGEELGGRPARVFWSEVSIETGERWPESLRLALMNSCCMVGVWLPSYFQSSWCISEWQSFLAREKELGMPSHTLIAPLKVHDGEHFPQEAKDIQCLDVVSYYSTMPAFWTSSRAMELEVKLQDLARAIARIIDRAKPFDPAWPVVELEGAAPPPILQAKL